MALRFVQGKRLWAEDDADVHARDHEGPDGAWARITGTEWDAFRAYVSVDYGDDEDFIIAGKNGEWYMVSRSWPGNSQIWELTRV